MKSTMQRQRDELIRLRRRADIGDAVVVGCSIAILTVAILEWLTR